MAQQVILEVIGAKNNVRIDTGIFSDGKYQIINVKLWHDRLIVYAKTAFLNEFKAVFARKFKGDKMILFDKPFYRFDRSYCSDQKPAGRWDNIIMSANLVKDLKMQQEYLAYHATQFQKWPEVSQGFCNAHFQQLLVFKNGRQLMLVISIPKGEGLGKLNPLTTKNNPRVDEWNRIMKKYQEGIAGTKPGEVWVEFKDVVN